MCSFVAKNVSTFKCEICPPSSAEYVHLQVLNMSTFKCGMCPLSSVECVFCAHICQRSEHMDPKLFLRQCNGREKAHSKYVM